VDGCGRVWTAVESKAFRSGLCGRLWTLVDGAWRSTDQKVGDSSSPGRARSTNTQALRLGVVNDTSVGLSCSSYGLDGEGL